VSDAAGSEDPALRTVPAVTGILEREVKLRFDSPAAARDAILAAGGTQVHERRLQSDALLDTPDGRLREAHCALRVRREPARSFLTYKGPPLPSTAKLREELETSLDDGALALSILQRIGFEVSFRYEKYREEFSLDDVLIAIDETPMGTFVEIEGSDTGIAGAAADLGRSTADYVVESYRALFVRHCTERGLPSGDMIFSESR
jgi:adenylate cyclase class 2